MAVAAAVMRATRPNAQKGLVMTTIIALGIAQRSHALACCPLRIQLIKLAPL